MGSHHKLYGIITCMGPQRQVKISKNYAAAGRRNTTFYLPFAASYSVLCHGQQQVLHIIGSHKFYCTVSWAATSYETFIVRISTVD